MLHRSFQHSYMGPMAGGPGAGFEPVPQPPPAARGRDGHMLRGPLQQLYMGHDRSISSDVGWRVSEVGEEPQRHKIRERLAQTIADADEEKTRYERKARQMGRTLNILMGLQVLLGALTTGISAASSSKQTSIGISILGGASTLVASYLARKRGSNEPQTSKTRVKDLDQFLRDCRAFEMDHGDEYGTHGDRLDARLKHLRRRLEEILGNADV
ncbi:hypothetical protein P692DRAFT_20787838 [Suillus brevipes Sb2]|nr:hypothetical protein P692DRAFT_20787838 [Suillus brevipes Sb2]